eukprot:259318_1
MSVFSPDESFENYFEVWLRANAPKADVYVSLLHRTYVLSRGSGLANIPSPSEYKAIMQNQCVEGFTEPAPDPLPYLDLLTPYDAALDSGGVMSAHADAAGGDTGKAADAGCIGEERNGWIKLFDEGSGFEYFENV